MASKGTSAENLDEATAALVANMTLTSGIRFEASKRHKNRYRMSNLSIVILSLYTILFSLAGQYIAIEKREIKEVLNMLSVFMSVFIIAFSLIEAMKRHEVRSENFLSNARSISELRDRLIVLKIGNNLNVKALEDINHEYNVLLQVNGDNHANLDMHIFYKNTRKYSFFRRKFTQFKQFTNIWNMSIIALLSPGII